METETATMSNSKKIRYDAFFIEKALQWATSHTDLCYLNPNGFSYPSQPFRHLLAIGAKEVIKPESLPAELKRLQQEHKWCFGFISYDYKNQLENLESNNPDGIKLPDYHFFVPEHLLEINETTITIHSANPEAIINVISCTEIPKNEIINQISINNRLTKEKYIRNIELLQQHILRGDIYEVNFCQEFYAENADIDPLQVYKKLNRLSPAPFSAFLKVHEQFLISASPERYIKKEENQLISQPIKGTAKRGQNEQEDLRLKSELYNSAKERSENVMIVDLVRNDLSQVCKPGSVRVAELFGIYTFPHVHQMISTIKGELSDGKSGIDALIACFPMGSMTGAPKLRAMQLIEEYESTKRGLFSGCVGYISPEGDFDFNVIIRSILYNSTNRYLSYQAGSAITYYADPVAEYDECLLKAAAIKKVLS